MNERNYTVAEIDSMRMACRNLALPGPYTPFYQEDIDRNAEEILRTYMQAGIEPQELNSALQEKWAQEQRLELLMQQQRSAAVKTD